MKRETEGLRKRSEQRQITISLKLKKAPSPSLLLSLLRLTDEDASGISRKIFISNYERVFVHVYQVYYEM